MVTLLYSLGVFLYSLAIMMVAPFNAKARMLWLGRRRVWDSLRHYINNNRCIWIHAASLGEFEQGRPLIEAIKSQYPERKIVLTFFSPSGFEVRKNYPLADLVCYLPADSFFNARRFIRLLNPEMAFFVKYEFWYFFLTELKKQNIPVYGVSVIFRPDQMFFKWYGWWFRKMLGCFTHFYLQDQASAELLKDKGYSNYTVAGDTRFDRVVKIAATSADDEVSYRFSQGARGVVAGSSWQPDEAFLINYINRAPSDVKLILVPHEIGEEHIRQIVNQIEVPYFLYKKAPFDPENYRVMIVNTIGLLSSIYKYGRVAYVGGGFGKGIHNTLEAATYGLPVLWGPNYRKFKEARDLIACGAGFVITNQTTLDAQLDALLNDSILCSKAGSQAKQYVAGMCGATDQIISDLF